MSNQSTVVVSFKPYKYSKVARQVTTYYQLIPSVVTFVSPYETTQYHPDDVLPASVQFSLYPQGKKFLFGLFAWFFKFLEFYSLFYHLFRLSPDILHVVFDDMNKTSLFAIEVYSFMKNPQIYAHLTSQKLTQQNYKAIESFILNADEKKITVLYNNKEILNELTMDTAQFIPLQGGLTFNHDMTKRVKLLTSQEFAQPEQVADGIRTAFEYFKFTKDNMIQGVPHPNKPVLVVMPISSSTKLDDLKEILSSLEQKAKEQQKIYTVLLTQKPCSKTNQNENIKKVIKFCKNFYEPKNISNNKLLNEKKPMSNVIVYQASLTDLDFDHTLQLADVRVALTENILFDLLSIKQICIAYNLNVDLENVINQSNPDDLATCITEIATNNLPFEGEIKLFEETLNELLAVSLQKDLVFAVPKPASGGCCGGGCGDSACGSGGCDDEKCGSGCGGCEEEENCTEGCCGGK